MRQTEREIYHHLQQPNGGTAPVTATITVTPNYCQYRWKTCSGTAKTFTITVNPIANVNTVTSQVVCNNTSTTAITFTGSVPGTVYNWTNDNTSIGLAASGAGTIASFTATNVGTTPVTATITVTPSYTNAGTTCTGSSKTFTITVNPTATVNAVSNQVVCNNTTTAAITFSGSVPGTVYNWVNNTPSIGLAANGTGDISSFTATNGGTAPVTATITVTPNYTNAGKTCSGTAKTFTITVNPIANVNTVTSQVVCNNTSTTAITFTGSVPGTVYNWTNDNTSIGLAASGAGTIASFTATNVGTTPVTATITVTPSYTNAGTTCTGSSKTFTITVNPTATVNAVSNQVVCNNTSTAAITFSGSVPGTVYNWVNNTPSIGLAANGTGDISSFTATNGGTAPVTATITVTPSYTNGGTTCTGLPITFTIKVNASPQGTLTANGPFCTSGTGQLTWTATNGTGPFTVIYNDGTGNQTANNVVSGTPFNVANNPVTVTTTYTLISVSDNNGCSRNSGFTGNSTTITVYQPPVITTDPVSQTTCATFPVSFTVTATGDNLTYQWYKRGTPDVALIDNSNISGSQAIELDIDQAGLSDAGTYYVIVSGSSPCTAAPSADAILTVNQEIDITSQPVAQAICTGSTASFTVVATGTGISYQ